MTDAIRKRKKYKPIKWDKNNLDKLKQMFYDGFTHEATGKHFGVSRLAITHQLRINNLYRLKKPLSESTLLKRNQDEKKKSKESFVPLKKLPEKEREVKRKKDYLRHRKYRDEALSSFYTSNKFLFWNYKIKKIKNKLDQRKFVAGKEFTITPDYLDKIWLKQKGKCFFTGVNLIPMSDGYKKKEMTMDLLSVDRIDNNKGYVVGNIRFLSDRINTMRSNLTNEEFYKLCKSIVNCYEKNNL